MLTHGGRAIGGNLLCHSQWQSAFSSPAYVGDMINAWDQMYFFCLVTFAPFYYEKKTTYIHKARLTN